MADEARAMLDQLMGQDRNASLPPPSSDNAQDWDSLRKKKSCYDNDICPLYCAWGVDVYELFTNTKSDLGPNPYIVQDDARAEYLTLPEHEKDRLGFERMLFRKLGDLVRSCDRIVSRNREKLRQEIAKAAKSRGGVNGAPIDPVTDVSHEMMSEAADMMADLELREEDVKRMLNEISKVEQEWNSLWNELQNLEKEATDNDTGTDTAGDDLTNEASDMKDGADPSTSNDKDETMQPVNENNENEASNSSENNETKAKAKEANIKEIKSKLYALSSEQQKIISTIANITSNTIVPLRDNLQNLTKQLYYVKTDISADKIVCDVSGNFMSSRDAEERIAAHYAGKQYVGWKMVREKFRELEKKSRSSRGGPPPGRYGGRDHDGPPPGRGGYDGRQGGYHDDRGRYNDRGRSYNHGHGNGGRDRSRYDDRGGGGGGYQRRNGRDGGYRGNR